MSSKGRIQTYLKRNRLSELFEDMMTKLVQDLPSEPVEYLIHFLKDRLPLDKKSKEKSVGKTFQAFPITSQNEPLSTVAKPRSVNTSKLASTTNYIEVDGKTDSSRHYQKPWLTNSRKSPLKGKKKQGLSESLPLEFDKSKNENDKSMEETDGLNIVEDKVADTNPSPAMPKVYGKPRDHRNEEDEELYIKASKSEEQASAVKRKSLKPKDAKKARDQKLKEMLGEVKTERVPSPVESDGNDDDALEIYERAEDLYEEGVKNPPKTGVYTSGNVPHRKEQIELVLNMSKFFDSLGGAVSVVGSNTAQSNPIIDNDEFESASQVTGPRQPVWDFPDSEVNSSLSRTQPLSTRQLDATMFGDTNSQPSTLKAGSRVSSVAKDEASSKVAEKSKKPRSQLSHSSRKSMEAKNSPSVNGERTQRRLSTKSASSRVSNSMKASLERPKTAQ